MSTQANKALVQRDFEEVWNQGNLAAVEEIFAASFTFHLPDREATGIESHKEYINTLRSIYPDLHYTIEDLIAEGDRVVARWTFRGTYQESSENTPADIIGKQITTTGISIYRIADDKIQEDWTNWDALGLYQQLGVVSLPGEVEE